MATEVDICNMALSQLGDEATVTSINPPEGSAQADHCARFYPIALREILSQAPWNFAIVREKLAALSATPVGDGDDYAYVIPSGCTKILNVECTELPFHPQIRYSVEMQSGQRVIITKAPSCWLRYTTSNVESDTFPAAFTQALVHKLASLLAGPMIPGSSGSSMAAQEIQLYEHYLADAIHDNAKQQFEKNRFRSGFLGDGVMEREHEFY